MPAGAEEVVDAWVPEVGTEHDDRATLLGEDGRHVGGRRRLADTRRDAEVTRMTPRWSRSAPSTTDASMRCASANGDVGCSSTVSGRPRSALVIGISTTAGSPESRSKLTR